MAERVASFLHRATAWSTYRFVVKRFVGLTLWLAVTARAETVKHTLPELIQLGRARARQVNLAQAELHVREAHRRTALLQWLPSGELTYGLSPAPRVRCAVPPGEQATLDGLPEEQKQAFRQNNCINTVDPGGNNINLIGLGSIASVGMRLNVSLTQPIYTFGKIENAAAAAGHAVAAGQAQVETARQDVDILVTRAFWGIKAARASLAAVESGRDELHPWIAKIEKDLDEPKPQFNLNDLERLKVALAQLDLVVSDLQRNEQTAIAGLRILCGDEVEVDESELDLLELVDRSLGYYEEAALLHRPEARTLDEGLKAYRSIAGWRRADLLPDLALVGSFAWGYAPTIEDSNNAYMTRANLLGGGLYLAFRQPLDLGQRLARLGHARADAEMFAAQRELALVGFRWEIDQVYNDLTEARKRTEATERGQKLARGWFTAVQQNIDLGIGEPRDLIEAGRAYFDLRLRYYQAIMDVNVNIGRLRRASGVEVAGSP